MGIITKDKTWADNENVTFTDINADFDALYNEFNGNIDNANIKAGAGIESSKIVDLLDSKELTAPVITSEAGALPTVAGQLKYDSTANQLKYGNGSTTITVGQQFRGFTWYLDGTWVNGTALGAKYIVPASMTVVSIKHKTTSGTATIVIKKDSTTINNTINVTSSLQTATTFASAGLVADQILTLDITANSACVGLLVEMECLQS